MKVEETFLKGCYIMTPKLFQDERGYFFESFHKDLFKDKTGLEIDFVQDNQSMSAKGVLRGLHFQIGDYEQAKLVRVIKGKALDVCVDLRRKSPTFGKHFSIILDDLSHQQLFIPRGFAHGFLVLEEGTIFNYKTDNYYNKESEKGIAYNDPDVGIFWDYPSEKLILSDKDRSLPSFKDYLIEN